MQAIIHSTGVWGPGFNSTDSLLQRARSGTVVDLSDTQAPKPALIPKRELRRAPLLVRVAVEVASQATNAATIPAQQLNTVFTSAMSDCDLTDYMCRALATDDKLLSPTKFHNSVHNAAAGYWSISTGCTAPATFVAGFERSFVLGLLETMVQITTLNVPVLLVVADIPTRLPMRDVLRIDSIFGAAFCLAPADSGVTGMQLSFSLEQGTCTWPDIQSSALDPLYNANPSARALGLLLATTEDRESTLSLPMNDHLHAAIKVYACR